MRRGCPLPINHARSQTSWEVDLRSNTAGPQKKEKEKLSDLDQARSQGAYGGVNKNKTPSFQAKVSPVSERKGEALVGQEALKQGVLEAGKGHAVNQTFLKKSRIGPDF